MTQKELLYMEDAISHERIINTFLQEACNDLEDEELVNFFEKEIEKHSSSKEKLMNVLKEKENE